MPKAIPKSTDKKATRPVLKEEAEPVRKSVVAVAPAKPQLDLSKLRRGKTVEEEPEPEPKSVSAGPVDKIGEYILNPSREKMREVTVIDMYQARLFPQLDMCGSLMHYVLEIAQFREDSVLYERVYKHKRPIPPDAQDEFLFRTAQWARSIHGKSLDAGVSLTMAEVESKADDDGMGGGGGGDAWKE